MINAFIFDLDGTLYPRTSPLFVSMTSLMKQWFQNQLQISDDELDDWYEWQKAEYPTPLKAIQAFGLSVVSFHQEVFGRIDPELYLTKDATLREMLSRLLGRKFLVTLSQYEYAVRVLNALGVRDCFADIFVHDRNWHTNDKLDIYEGIRRANGLVPAEICVIGDNPRIDLLAAHEAGYRCIVISDGEKLSGIKTIRTVVELPLVVQDCLLGPPDEKTLLIASFFMTNKEALMKLQSQWAVRNPEHSKVLGRTKQQIYSVPESEFGGSIVLLDPYRLEEGVLAELAVPLAFGLCFNSSNSSLYVTSGTVVRRVKNGRCVEELNNPLFNDLHTLTATTSGNLLVVSTGVDGILEVDFGDASKVYWDWLATEHGYDRTATGNPRFIDRNLNYQKVLASTPEHTTHVNSALNDIPGRLLTTFFHQGTLVEIDMISKRSRIILEGLKSPHNIRRREGGYVLSDSRANKLLLLNRQLEAEGEIVGDFNWVQDALELDDNSYLIGDSNNDRILRVNRRGEMMSSFSWDKNSKKFAGFTLITEKQAREVFLSERSTER